MASPAAILEIWVNAQTGTASGKLTKFNSEMKASEAQADRSSNAIGGKLAKSMKLLGVAAAAGAAYGLYKAVDAGAQFEKQIDSLGSVSGASAKQIKRLEQQALDLGESTQYTANQVAEAQTELAKGGLTVAQIYGGALTASLSLAAAGELELAAAAETTVNAMKLFGLHGKDSVQIADMLATAANKTTADVTDFAMALKQGGSVAKLAGLDLNNTVTILEALAESGIKNSDAGTSMKTAMIQLLKPTEKQRKLAEELGIIWTTQNGTIKTAAGISKELRSATEGMTKAERAKTLATLAGTDGVRTLNALYAAGPEKLQRLEQANRKAGTAQKVAAEKMDNLKGDWEQFTGALETAEIKLYKVLKGPLRATTQWLTGAVQTVSNFDFAHATEEAEHFMAKLHEMGNVSFAGLNLNVFDTYWGALKKEAEIYVAYLKALPGIATAVFGAVAAAERWVVRASEDLAEWVGRAYRNVVGFVGALIPVKVALLAVKLAIAPVVGLMMGLFKALKILSPIVVAAANNFKSVWVAAMKVSLAIVQVLLKFIGNIGAVVGDVVGVVSNLLRGNWSGAWKNAKQLFVDVWHTIIDLLKGGWTAIRTLFSSGTKAIVQILGNSAGALVKVAGNIGEALKGTFSSAWDKIKGTFTSGANAVIDVINAVIDVLNVIPGIPDIGNVGQIGGGGGSRAKGGEGLHRQHRQAGGMIVPGTGSGDKFRTALPPKSFVLNRKATAVAEHGLAVGGMVPVALEPGERVFLPREVKAMGGVRKLEAMNRSVPRFQKGGEVQAFGIGGIVEDAVNVVSPVGGKVAGKAVDVVSNVAGKGADYFIGKLPKPDLPEPFAALGPYVVSRVADYIKSGFAEKKLGNRTPSVGGSVGSHPELQPGISGIVAAILKRWPSLAITSTTGGGHAENSLHYEGRAADLAADPGYMLKAAAWIRGKIGTLLTEGIHNPNLSIKYGKEVDPSYWTAPVWADHIDHIHVGKQLGGAVQALAKGGPLGVELHERAKRIWEVAAPFYGQPAQSAQPSLHVPGPKWGGTGVFEDGTRSVHLGPSLSKALLGKGNLRNWAEETLIHEWAHYFQPALSTANDKTRWQVEGGAEAFARWAAPQIYAKAGLDYANPSRLGYPEFTRRVIKEKGWDWIKYGQFMKLGGLVRKLSVGGPVPPKAGELVGASYYGGPTDHVSGTVGAAGVSLPGKMSFAELAMGKALGGLPFHSKLKIGYNGKSVIAEKLDIGAGGDDVKGYNRAIDLWYETANAIGMPGTGVVKVSPVEGQGGANLTAGQEKAREGEARKKAREAQLKKLRAAVAEAKTDPAKQSKLWQVVKFWGRNGMFDKDERGKVLDYVQQAAGKTKVGDSIKVLQNLAAYAGEHGEITGKDPSEWHSLIDAMNKAQERGKEHREKALERQKRKKETRRNKKLAKIAERAEMPDLISRLYSLRKATDAQDEIATQLVALEPENLTDEYVGQERGAFQGSLNDLRDWRNVVVQGRMQAAERIRTFQAQILQIQSLKGTKYFEKQKWKLPGLREAIQTTTALRDETLLGELEELSPLALDGVISEIPSTPTAGQFGGRIFDAQNTIRELGLKVGSSGGPDDSDRLALVEEMLLKANQRNLVFERQKPIIDAYEASQPALSSFAGMYAKGGSIPAGMWGIAGERGLEPVFGPATVVSNPDAQKVFGGSSKVVVQVFEGDASKTKVYVDEKQVEAVVEKVNRRKGRGAQSIGAKRAGRGIV